MRGVFILIALAVVPASAGTMVEEVLAVVDRTPILKSDIELAMLVGLSRVEPAESKAELRSRLLDLRIRLELQLRDLESTGVLYRIKIDQETSLARLLEQAGGEHQLRAHLPEHGLVWSDVEALALRMAVATAYVEQRLRPQVAVSLDELQQAYQRLVDEELAPQGVTAPPLATVRDQLHQLLVERKLNAEIERWIEQAGERLGVTRFAE
jgi:cation transport regulator ChaC